MRPIDHAVKERVNRTIKLTDLCVVGFWFCNSCQRVTELTPGCEVNKCVICGAFRVKWCPPVSEPQ